MFKKMLILTAGLLVATCAFSQVIFDRRAPLGRDHVPQVRLIYPVKEIVMLKGKDKLEFKWSPHEGRRFGRKYYDFRLYKGYEMVQSTLILKKRVPGDKHSESVDAGIFKDGKVYTWSVRQVYPARGKSTRSYHSFKVNK